MPLYEYQCENCGETFEVMQKFADEPVKTHEKCGGKVHRLISAPAFHLKGSGWYATDYAKGSGNNPAPNGPTKKADSSSGSSEKSSESSTPSSSSSGKSGSGTKSES